MDSSTGRLYPSRDIALEAGVKPENLVELFATPAQADDVSRKMKLGIAELEKRAARKAMQKKSRRANRP